MKRPWTWWVTRCGHPIDSRPLALVRIGAALCILGDLLRVAQLGLVPHLFRTFAQGGLSKIQDPALVVDSLLGVHTGPVLFTVSVICMAMVALGVGTRPAILIGVLAYAQLGHLYPPGDRGIDRILRTVLLILLFSQSHRRFTLPLPWRQVSLPRVAGWPADMVRFVMVMVYLSAGISKLMTTSLWLSTNRMPVLYRILTDPMAAHIDPVAAQDWSWLFRLGSWFTILFELSSPLILTPFAWLWAGCGILMHIGIGATMELGMFAWGMLVLFPLLAPGTVTRFLDRWSPTGPLDET